MFYRLDVVLRDEVGFRDFLDRIGFPREWVYFKYSDKMVKAILYKGINEYPNLADELTSQDLAERVSISLIKNGL